MDFFHFASIIPDKYISHIFPNVLSLKALPLKSIINLTSFCNSLYIELQS